MSIVLQISDTHFGTERPPVVAALTRFARHLQPDLLILSGDITQRALPREFAAARQFVDGLGVANMLAIPGNHDIPLFDLLTRAFAPYSRYRKEFGDELEPVFESDDLLVIGVRTTRRYRHIQGEVSREQLQAVSSRLQGAHVRQLRIVVTHQPIHVTRQEDEENLLRRHAQAIASWSKAGADLVLGGHIHRPSVSATQSEENACRIWAVQAGTALSSRIRFDAGNSVNVIRYDAQQAQTSHCIVERWDYDEKVDEFVLREQHQLPRNRC